MFYDHHTTFKPGVYQHYKGGTYRAMFLAHNSTNGQVEGEKVVVYVCLTPALDHPEQIGQINVRTLEQWNESVMFKGRRFQFLHD